MLRIIPRIIGPITVQQVSPIDQCWVHRRGDTEMRDASKNLASSVILVDVVCVMHVVLIARVEIHVVFVAIFCSVCIAIFCSGRCTLYTPVGDSELR